MSIGISEEHVELARSLRKWAASLGRRARRPGTPRGTPARRSPSPGRPCVEMGVATIGLPESHGGGGGSVLDQAVALEACAHELVPGPLLGPRSPAARRAVRRDRRDGPRSLGPAPDVGLAGDLAVAPRTCCSRTPTDAGRAARRGGDDSRRWAST